MEKISQKITKTSVKNSKNLLEREVSIKPLEKLPREDMLEGRTYKVKTPIADYSFYITINQQNGKPFEIFIDSKNQNYFQIQRVLSLTISAFLRTGSDIDFLLTEYKELHDPDGGFYGKYKFLAEKSVFYPSFSALIATILETHINLCKKG